MPSANQLVYDNYNALAIGFCPSERAYDSIFSVAVFPRGVNLFFFHGPNLPDPKKLLKGDGNMVRHIRLDSVVRLDDPPSARSWSGDRERADPPLAPADAAASSSSRSRRSDVRVRAR